MSKAKMITVGAVCVALAFVLNQVTLFRMPMGGSITPFSMLFIVLAGYWLGPAFGIIAGAAMGLLGIATGAYVVGAWQLLLDYVFAYAALGLSGVFRKQKFGLHIGYIAGVLGRYVFVVLSGVLFFYMWAPEGQPVIVYSLIYNITYIGPEALASLVIISLPAVRQAIDEVTKGIVSHDDYARMRMGGISGDSTLASFLYSPAARLVSGSVMAALGGIAFVVANYITRLELHAATHYAIGATLFDEEASRLLRNIARNTGQIFALQSVGVVFLAVAAGLMFSVMLSQKPVRAAANSSREPHETARPEA